MLGVEVEAVAATSYVGGGVSSCMVQAALKLTFTAGMRKKAYLVVLVLGVLGTGSTLGESWAQKRL